MRDFLRSTGGPVWMGLFWPLVLLALSGGLLTVLSSCALQAGGLPGLPSAFDGGPEPRTSAVMCDIPKVPSPGSNDCANSTETGFGMSMSRAAVALVQGESSSLALDVSPAATNACGGFPRKIEFQGAFPDGYAVCLNCGTQMPVPYKDANDVCVAQCIDLINHGDGPEPEGGAESFCQLNARVSTNFDKTTCFENACSSGGTLLPNFVDPRRTQEPVKWVDLIGTTPTGNTLTRTLPTSNPVNFDAGAASDQLIMKGDAWVEFEAAENNQGHAVGLSAVPVLPGGVPVDGDPSLKDIDFAIVLRTDGNVYIFEGGTKIIGPGVNGSIGTYNAGDRFRVRVTDNNDLLPHTATITYTRLTAPCTPAPPGTAPPGVLVCPEIQIGSQTASSPTYPLRVDASLNQAGATLTNVTLVRIK